MAKSTKLKRKQTQDRRALILIAVIGVVAAGIVGAYFYVQQSHVPLDTVSLCPIDGPRELTAVLIDRTDPLNKVQSAALRVRLQKIKTEVPRYGEIQIYTVRPLETGLLRPELRICNPGRGADVNPAIGNPRLAERKWQESFASRLDALIAEMVASSEANVSPVMESVQSVALSAFSSNSLHGKPKKLIIVSDMIQNTPGHSQYRGITSFQNYKTSKHYRHVRADLTNVSVEIIYILRDTKVRDDKARLQGKRHIEFWQHFFADMGEPLGTCFCLKDSQDA